MRRMKKWFALALLTVMLLSAQGCALTMDRAYWLSEGWHAVAMPENGDAVLCVLPTEEDAVLEIMFPEGAVRRFLRQGVMHFELIRAEYEQVSFRIQGSPAIVRVRTESGAAGI